MIMATIYLDGEPFSGVDLAGSDYTPPGAFRTGFHNNHSQGGSDRYLFGGEPHVCIGARNVRHYVEGILERLGDGRLAGSRVEIRLATRR